MRSMSSLAKNASVNGGPPGRITARIRSRVVGLKSRHNTVDAAAPISTRYHPPPPRLRRARRARRGVERRQRRRGAMAFREADDGRRAIEHARFEVLNLLDEDLG